jgi:YD repeat-containing protein
MNQKNQIKLKYLYEKVPNHQGILTRNVRELDGFIKDVLNNSPLLIPKLPFGHINNIKGSAFDPQNINKQLGYSMQKENIRLKCIEFNGKPLLEYNYDRFERISEVFLPDSTVERYEYSESGKIISIQKGNSLKTQYSYQQGELLSSIKYPNGSEFTYKYDTCFRLRYIIYPDNQISEFNRNDFGLLVQSKNNKRGFNYIWDKESNLHEIQYQYESETWKTNPNENNKIKLDFRQRLDSGHYSVSSVLGHWCYDQNKSLYEMFVAGGERYVKSGNLEKGIEQWSSNGQTSYRFDSDQNLVSVTNSDGTSSVFIRGLTERTIFEVSSKGVAFLHYDKEGKLLSERDKQNNGFSYILTKQNMLRQLSNYENTIIADWTMGGKLKKLKLDNKLKFVINYNSDIPSQLSSNFSSYGNVEAMENLIRFIWEWEAMSEVRGLIDSNMKM